MRKSEGWKPAGAVKWMLLPLLFGLWGCRSAGEAGGPNRIELVHDEAARRVDVVVDGQLFTAYLYTDTLDVLKKPVLYPVRTARGKTVTRGFPLDNRPGERVDHPHHIGFWFNYGDVNGLDFWNNSNAIPPERAPRMGTIRHKAINRLESGTGTATLNVSMNWLDAAGKAILQEDTRFIFYADEDMRAVDRITRLTALDAPVSFRDNKEGVVAIRVTRALEHPSNSPITVTDASGKATEVPVLDNSLVTGKYESSRGVTGTAVWGTRAEWVMLSGVVDGDSTVVALFDHPQNVGYPTYWHARGYGLFAANPLGQKIFSRGKEELNFALEPGESTTFRHRLLLLTGDVSRARVEKYYAQFTGN